MRLLSNCHRPQAVLQIRRKWPVNSWEAERLAGTGKTTPEADQYRSRDICSAEFRPSIMRSGRRQEHGAAYGVSIWEGREESSEAGLHNEGRYFDPKVRKYVETFDSARSCHHADGVQILGCIADAQWRKRRYQPSNGVEIGAEIEADKASSNFGLRWWDELYWIGDKDGVGDKCSLYAWMWANGAEIPFGIWATFRLMCAESRWHNGVIVRGVGPDLLGRLGMTLVEREDDEILTTQYFRLHRDGT
ncbi:hypothetical protein H4582DRAFT_2130986 [Lactarius indigo]|nr:hypothetical protein H4582DRAFT_2130986 [Lactarius indigo]